MTDLTTPGETGAAALSTASGHAWDKGGEPWIVDGVDIADQYSSLDDTQLDGFRHATTSGLDVTIAAGEAYVAGWLCRDRTTTITLPASTTTAIFVGYDAGAVLSSGQAPADSENVIVGPAGDFSSEDPRTPIYEFTTDADTVTGSTDHRKLTEPVSFDPVADRVDVAADLSVRGEPVATEAYVDAGRYSDADAQDAVTDTDLPGRELRLPNVDGYTDGVRVGPGLEAAFSALQGQTTIYSLHDGGAVRFRNHITVGDLLVVDNAGGGGWVLGGWEVDNGLLDNSDGAGVVPKVLGSNESLPGDTVTGRQVYDPSREE